MKHTIIICATLAIAGCAAAPAKVPAAMVSQSQYDGQSCESLAALQTQNEVNLAALTKRQNDTHNRDVVGVLLLGLPTASMSGEDVAKQLGQAKGEQIALADAKKRQGCAI